MKEKIKNILIKNYFNIFCFIFIIITITNAFQIKKLRNEISHLKEEKTNLDLITKTSENFSKLEKNVVNFFDFISNSYLSKQEENRKKSEDFKKSESIRLINTYNKNEEDFFKEFEDITGIERIK